MKKRIERQVGAVYGRSATSLADAYIGLSVGDVANAVCGSLCAVADTAAVEAVRRGADGYVMYSASPVNRAPARKFPSVTGSKFHNKT